MSKYLKFPSGLHLLKRWQADDADAKEELRTIFDAAISGRYDTEYAVPTPTNACLCLSSYVATGRSARSLRY